MLKEIVDFLYTMQVEFDYKEDECIILKNYKFDIHYANKFKDCISIWDGYDWYHFDTVKEVKEYLIFKVDDIDVDKIVRLRVEGWL